MSNFPYWSTPGCGCGPYPPQNWQQTQCIQPQVSYTNQCGPLCVYENVAHLRLETVLVQNRVARTKGLTAPYDTEGHDYIFEAAETAADDGVNYIRPNIIDSSQPGRWRLWA